MPSKSKKQARLMAAVAHNPRFAKKVGIPQSVGREFNDADRVLRKYAEGGKVRTVKQVLDQMRGVGNRFSRKRLERILKENPGIEEYVEPTRLIHLARSENPTASLSPDEFLELASRVDSTDPIKRRAGVVLESLQKGDALKFTPFLDFAHPDESLAQVMGHDGRARATALKDLGLPSIPVELLVPSLVEGPRRGRGRIARSLNKAKELSPEDNREAYDTEQSSIFMDDRAFAEGGEVLPSSTDDNEDWTDTYLKRPLSGLASQWLATDPETGELVNPAWHNIKRVLRADARRKQGLPREEMAIPGIIQETASIPALGGLVGLPVPEFAEKAAEGADEIHAATRGSLGLDAPHGFVENTTEALGTMVGQMPVPASVANKLKLLKEGGGKLGKYIGPAVEWFSPTVVPKAANYIKGTLFGGGIGGTLDHLTDALDARAQKRQHKQDIHDAMAEVFEEERREAAEAEGSEETDDAALAELGYAEGGRVKTAKKAIGSLRQLLSEADPEDVATRKALLDQAVASLRGTSGLTGDERAHLQTLSGGLGDALDTDVPMRRKQRFTDYENSLVRLLESKAPTLTERPTGADLTVTPTAGPQPQLPQVDMTDPSIRLDRDLGPMDPSQMLTPSDNRWGSLTQEEWEKMLGIKPRFAAGGKVTTNNPWDSPQSQKPPSTQPPADPNNPTGDPRGAPLSQDWYEHYGEGPEHLFLGDRTIKLSDYWGPQHPGAVPQTPQQPTGSWLPGIGIVGLSLYDEWKKRRAAGQDASQQAFWADMQQSATNTSDTDAWVNQQLNTYGDYTPMPQMNADGSISYVQPSQFWRGVHDSAANTSDTNAWVDQQLNDYSSSMLVPHVNDDGTVSYTDQNGNVVKPGAASFGSRAFQGVGGAYDLYGGLQQGGVQGYTQALSGVNDLYGAYTGTGTGALGQAAGAIGGLGGVYSGIQEGGVRGYSQAAAGAAQTANSLGYTNAAVSGLGTAATVVGALYSAYGAYESAAVGDKKGAVAQGAAAGAAVGSIIPVVGTAVGAVVGAIVGLVGASLGNKDMPSELYYGAHKKLAEDAQIRGWGEDQVNGAVYETIKSHTKSGNVNKFKDVGEMYTAFGITKDAHKNYKNVQTQMGDFIKGVISTAQQMGALPTDPRELRQLDGQKVYYEVVVPAMAAKFKESTGKESTAWNKESIKAGTGAEMQSLFADWTDWMMSHWGGTDPRDDMPRPAQPVMDTSPVRAMKGVERATGGLVYLS